MKSNRIEQDFHVDFPIKTERHLQRVVGGNSPWFETKTRQRVSDPIAQTIAVNLKRARFKADLSQRDAAVRVGCKPNLISSWELGRVQIGIVSLVKLLRIYGVSLTQILTGEGLPDLNAAFDLSNQPPRVEALKAAPKVREHSDSCDAFEPSLMCPDCLAILKKVTA